jgi:hypothetical protein
VNGGVIFVRQAARAVPSKRLIRLIGTMLRIPDLVRDSKLETTFDDNQSVTIHKHHDTDSERRRILRKEYWRLERPLGHGSYGQVRLERCLAGSSVGSLRAVKKVLKHAGPNSVDYNRELEAVAKFSHARVRISIASVYRRT